MKNYKTIKTWKLIGISLVVVYIISLTIWSPKTIKAQNFSIQEQKENYLPTEIISQEPKVMINMSEEIEKARQMLIERDSPLVDYVEVFFTNTDDPKKAWLALGIANAESGLGKSEMAIECNNYFGYLYSGTSKRGCYSPLWDTPEHAIKRFLELEGNRWLGKYDGTYESLDQFVGKGGYCQSSCDYWEINVINILEYSK